MKQIRQFVLDKPILDEFGGIRLPSMIQTYGIFFFSPAGNLEKIVSYDMDGEEIEIPFSLISSSTSKLHFSTVEEVEKEIDRLRQVELILPKINMRKSDSFFETPFAREAILLTQLRMLAQFRIVLQKF
jgi:hypothetical protein